VNTISNPMLQATLLLAILSFYACSLVTNINALKQSRVEFASSQTRELGFRDPTGIDIDGKVLQASLHSKQYIAFVLRRQSLRSDLGFWVQVSALLGPRADLTLVAYCDGQLCAESMRTLQVRPFPVLAYGEAVNAQSLADADGKGLAILRIAGKADSAIMWRGQGIEPRKVIEGAAR